MPSKPGFIHSWSCHQTYTLKTGGEIELRRGCVFRNNQRLTWSDTSEQWIREHCRLTDAEAERLASVIELETKSWTPANNNRVIASVSPAHGSKFKEGE